MAFTKRRDRLVRPGLLTSFSLNRPSFQSKFCILKGPLFGKIERTCMSTVRRKMIGNSGLNQAIHASLVFAGWLQNFRCNLNVDLVMWGTFCIRKLWLFQAGLLSTKLWYKTSNFEPKSIDMVAASRSLLAVKQSNERLQNGDAFNEFQC